MLRKYLARSTSKELFKGSFCCCFSCKATNLPILPHHAIGWEILAGLAQALEIKTKRDRWGIFFSKKIVLSGFHCQL